MRRIGIVLFVIFSSWTAEAAVNCTSAGRFADDSVAGCQTYVLCVYVSSNASYVGYTYTCPSTSVFNPDTSLCTDPASYTCTTTNTTTTNTTTNSSVCTEDGYIADNSSTDCSTYISCVEINGTYTETTETCPTGYYFDPTTELCEDDYVCTTNTTTTFTCTAAGRFADTSVTGCTSYYLCVYSSTNATYTAYEYTCPSTSIFNPDTSLCTDPSTYTCTT